MDNNWIVDLLNEDLKNEYKHMNFYLYHASAITGLHREEYRELLLKSAADEMSHITAFSDLIIGLGGIPTSDSNPFNKFTSPTDIINYAIQIEAEVVDNYVKRIQDANNLGGTDGRWLEIFLEKQIEDSRQDLDNFRQISRNS